MRLESQCRYQSICQRVRQLTTYWNVRDDLLFTSFHLDGIALRVEVGHAVHGVDNVADCCGNRLGKCFNELVQVLLC